MQQDAQLAGVDNSNELHNKINEMQNNEHKSIVADMLSSLAVEPPKLVKPGKKWYKDDFGTIKNFL